MDRNYKTSHQGIAAYLVTQGYEILRAETGKNKQGRSVTFFFFDIEQNRGREAGDEFLNGFVNGNLKQFYDALAQVRQKAWEARRSTWQR